MTKSHLEYVVDLVDPISGKYTVVTAKLYKHGDYVTGEDESGYWADTLQEPEFYSYTYDDMETGETGAVPEEIQATVDIVLANIYWDRELNR